MLQDQDEDAAGAGQPVQLTQMMADRNLLPDAMECLRNMFAQRSGTRSRYMQSADDSGARLGVSTQINQLLQNAHV